MDNLTYAVTELRKLAFAQTAEQKLAVALLHSIEMERKAATRVKRASTLLHKWQAKRRRVEKKIGQQEVQAIIARYIGGQEVRAMKKEVQAVVNRHNIERDK